MRTLHDLYHYFKKNLQNTADPIIHTLLRTHRENWAHDRFRKENYFTLEFYIDFQETDQMSLSVHQSLHKKPSDFGHRNYYSVQMSILEIRKELHFVFIFDDITLNKKMSQIQSEAINYKDHLMASVSHELRTPLNGIINMIEHAMCESSNIISDNFLYPALNSSKLLLSIISDFLDYSMINANKLRLDFSRFHLKAVCIDCVKLVEPQARMKGIQIRFNFKKGTPFEIFSEPNRLKQVLLNFLINAVKFTNKGYVILEVGKIGQRIHFSIKDTGIGIDLDEKTRIEKIISENNYLIKVNKNSTGAGLGLKISSKLIELLNKSPDGLIVSQNAIICQSETGKGTQFSFEIFNHESDFLKGFRSESQLFETKKGGQGSIKLIFSSIDKKEKFPENFQRIEEYNENLSLNGFEQFDIKNSTLNKFDVDDDEGNHQINIFFDSLKIKPIAGKQEIYRFATNFKENDIESLKEHDEIDEENNSDINKKQEVLKGCVLVVDDDFYNIEVMKFFLKMFNYRIDFANNGKEAIKKIELNRSNREGYCLILMDFNMPIMDGVEATTILMNMMERGEIEIIPIIGVTAYLLKEEVDKGFIAGMKEILYKPIKKDELKEVLERYARKNKGKE